MLLLFQLRILGFELPELLLQFVDLFEVFESSHIPTPNPTLLRSEVECMLEGVQHLSLEFIGICVLPDEFPNCHLLEELYETLTF